MSERSWSIGSILSRSIELFKVHWAIIMAAMLILVICASSLAFGTQLIVVGLSMVAAVLELDPGIITTATILISVVGGLVQTFLSFFIIIGYFRFMLQVVRNEQPSIRTLFTGLPNLLSALLAGILIALGSAIGTLLLIIRASSFPLACSLFS